MAKAKGGVQLALTKADVEALRYALHLALRDRHLSDPMDAEGRRQKRKDVTAFERLKVKLDEASGVSGG